MSHGWLLLGLVALLPQGDPVVAEALKDYQHPWAVFAEGASVTQRETFRQPDIDAAGKLAYKAVTNEVTWSVALIEGEKTTLRIEGEGGQESAIPYFIGFPTWARGVGEKKGTEVLEIGGKKLTCEVTEILLDPGKDASQRTTIAKSSEVPYWMVRRRVETFMQGKLNTSEEERVVEVGAKVKVGARELGCVVVDVTVEAAGYTKTVRREWRTDEVPGRVAKRVVKQYTAAGKEVEGAASEMDVVRFKLKR
jgi:hypothetical protein